MSHIVHLLNPAERVKANLQDAASLFPKGEGHSEKKALEERWRLIWNISEPDRLIDAFINGDQCHCDVLTHQGECGDLACLAVGNGHDDGGLQRTYRDLEAVLAKSLRRRHTVEWLHLVQTQCKGYDLPCRAAPGEVTAVVAGEVTEADGHVIVVLEEGAKAHPALGWEKEASAGDPACVREDKQGGGEDKCEEFGLPNNCYVNATLQALFHTPSITHVTNGTDTIKRRAGLQMRALSLELDEAKLLDDGLRCEECKAVRCETDSIDCPLELTFEEQDKQYSLAAIVENQLGLKGNKRRGHLRGLVRGKTPAGVHLAKKARGRWWNTGPRWGRGWYKCRSWKQRGYSKHWHDSDTLSWVHGRSGSRATRYGFRPIVAADGADLNAD
ncbi:unnamed protein product [Symbiodinium sp. KB8]|nr:unnamed protein product [Symbiodinium sp. KB8]